MNIFVKDTILIVVVLTLWQCNSKEHKVGELPSLDLYKFPVAKAQESIKKIVIQDGFKIELVASEPQVVSPIALDFDYQGRIWAVEMSGFMPDTSGTGENTPNGKIVILEDTDRDGKMDLRKVFLDSLVLPRAICLIENGLLVGEPPNLWFYEIENDRPGKSTLVDAEYAVGGNVEHQPNGLFRALDNWIYNAKSEKRYRRKDEQWIIDTTHFRGQWGITQDNYGRLFYNTNSVNLLGDFFSPGFGSDNRNQDNVVGFNEQIIENNRVYPIRPTPGVNRGYQEGVLDDKLRLRKFTAACSPVIYRGALWKSQDKNFSFVAEPAANLVKSNTLISNGFNVKGVQTYKEEEFLASTDERFRPVSLYNGPDGALYIVDMYRGILEHKTYMTPYLKKEIKKRKLTKPLNYGRIYKVFPENSELFQKELLKDPVHLVELLRHPNGALRDMVQQKIIDRQYKDLVPALRESLDNSKDLFKTIHSLWTLEGLGCLEYQDIISLLSNPSWPLRMQALSVIPSIVNESNNKKIFYTLEQKHLQEDTLAAPYIAFLADKLYKYDDLRATDLLLSLSKMYPENSYVVDAVISSLERRETNFQTQLMKEVPDTSLKIHQKLKEIIKTIKKSKTNRGLQVIQKKYPDGSSLYSSRCESCHGKDGNGIKLMAPPLNQSKWVTGNKSKLILIALFGLKGPITVNDHLYEPPEINGEMPGIGYDQSLSDSEIAEILSFIRQSWQNNASQINAPEVGAMRQLYKNRQKPFTVKELNSIQ